MINMDVLINNPKTTEVVKGAVRKAKSMTYLRLGDFLKGLSDLDLMHLNFMFESMLDGDDASAFNIVALTEVLSNAEGVPSMSVEETRQNVGYLATVLSLESLSRRGVVEIFHNNLTFGADLGDATIARLVE